MTNEEFMPQNLREGDLENARLMAMSEEEIRKFCEDFAFNFMSKLSLDPDFDGISGNTMARVMEDLTGELEFYVKRMITFNKLVKKQ